MAWMVWLLWLILAYLAGSLPIGVWIGRAHGVDIRTQGSGNPGATNVGRLLGRGWGITCFVLDVVKGAAAVVGYGLASGLIGRPEAGTIATLGWLAVAVAAMVGHMFPVWLGFRGGKGVATGLGAVLGLYPVLTLAGVGSLVVWLVTVRLSRYVSLASIAAALVLPVLAVAVAVMNAAAAGQVVVLGVVTLLLAALVVWRHRTNIARLRAGTEEKVTWTD